MYYVHYYSKVRPTLHGDAEKEIEYAKGRIATKKIDSLVNVKFHEKDLRKMKEELRALVDAAKSVPVSIINEEATYSPYYTKFRIPKRSGGMRTLHAPYPELKAYQKRVQRFIEDTCKALPDNAVHSYIKNRNCKTAMEVHQKNKSRWFLKLDIKNFFDNITTARCAAQLVKLYPFCFLDVVQLERIITPCFLDNTLPQGSPASPVLSNLYLSAFDDELKIALGKDFCYTRYADDILISSRKSFGFGEVVTKVDRMLQDYGLKLNGTKVRYGSCNGANWNLGLMYNQDLGITVGYRHKHIMKCMIHNLYTHREDTEDWHHEQAKLLGLLNYYKFIEPGYFTPLITKYKEKGYLQ